MSDLTLPSLVRAKPALKTVRAAHTFEGRTDEELSFQAGDLIEVLSMSDKNWWEGRCGGSTGTFPSNYVEDAPDEMLAQKQSEQQKPRGGKGKQQQEGNSGGTKVVTALHNFKARTPDELSFKKGDVITVLREIDANFWEGSLKKDSGCVPKTYVTEPIVQPGKAARSGVYCGVLFTVQIDR